MRSLSLRSLFLLFVFCFTPALFAHDITVSGTQNFSSLDGSSSDHDGLANGVFTVNDGNLTINGTVNCNDTSGTHACAMAFAVSGNMTVNSGGALYAENRSGDGNGGAITLTVGGGLALNGTAIISAASTTSGTSDGGSITANVGGAVTLAAGTTLDVGAPNGQAGAISVTAGGVVTANGNLYSGASRTLLSTRLTGAALSGGNGNQSGGSISISSTSFVEPAIVVGATANIVSQGEKIGAGPVKLDGCGIEIRGLVAALSRRDQPARVAIRSGKGILVDGSDLGGTGTRMGRVRGDSLEDGASNNFVDLFAADDVQVLGPTSSGGTLFAVSAVPTIKANKDTAGTIRVISTGGGVSSTGRAFLAGVDNKSTRGGTVSIAAADTVNLDGTTIVAIGDHSNPTKTAGGHIIVRSYGGSVLWRNGTGDVRPVGSLANVPVGDQGTIVLTACGTVDTTGSSFPTNGVATSMFPETHTGVCSPAAPSLPAGEPPLATCNTPPVANDTNATTNEDTTVTIFLSGSDADGDSLTFSIVSGPSNGSLGAIIPTGPTTATVDYSPDFNYFGPDSFVFRADDGNGGIDDATASITVNPVNDPPTFLAGPTVNVLEDSGAQTIPNWVTSISPGPANESGQTVTFTVTNDNNALFSVQPAVSSTGTLTFTPAANAFGSATITIVAQDNGGIANGGNDTSAPQNSTINVNAVNDEPSFVAGGDVTVNEDSGAYSAPWASGISAGPNEGGQTVSFNVSNDNNALFSVQPAISPSGVLTFTPAADAFGTATVSVFLTDDGGIANGGDDTSPTVTFTITVDSVNDEPSFTPGGDVSVLEDSGSYSATWATAISAGPANESSQGLTFNVSNNNNALFSAQPAIAPNGTLTFTPAANAFGTATVSVFLMDDGGIANGGDDTSPTVMFTITVDPVNDAPSFTPGGNVSVNEDSGAYSAAWATAISAGPPNESGQTVAFNVSNDNNALFSAQPSISPTGVLSFTPAPNAFGSATVSVSLSDDGGIANGGVDTSPTVTFTITVNGINDPPTAGTDTFATFGNTEVRVDLAPSGTPHRLHTTGSGTGVLDNDADTVEGDPFAITAVVGCSDTTAPFDCTFGDGSVLSLNANGTFTFTPGPGTTTASFGYTVTDMPSAGTPASANGIVNIPISEMVWYVNGAAAGGGNGTSIAPFNNFASLNGPGGVGDVDLAGHIIFVHNSTVNDSIGLETNERLLGEGVGLTLSSYTLVPAGTRPTINGGANNAVSVSGVTGTEIAGLTLNSTSANGIDVTSNVAGPAAGANIHDNVVSGAGAEGIDINGGSAAGLVVTIDNTSITSTSHGLDVTSTGPVSIGYSNGSILSTAGSGIRMSATVAGNLTVTALSNVTIDGNTTGDGINLNLATFDAVPGGAFNTVSGGAIAVGTSGNPVGGAGVVMSNVSGDYGMTSLNAFSSGANAAVSIAGSGLFTGAAGMRVTNGGGNAVAVQGTGLGVTNATIGAAGMTFTRIASSGGTATGIILDNTGNVGGLTVSGSGAAGTGGTISNKSGADGATVTGNGIYLNNTSNVSLAWMQLNGFQNHGIRGFRVNNFSMSNTVINGTNGTSDSFDNYGEGSVMFGDDASALTNGLTGSASVTNSNISGGRARNFSVVNTAGVLNRLTVTGTTFGLTNAAGVGSSFAVEARNGGTTANATVTGSTFTGAAGDIANFTGQTGTTMDVVFQTNGITNTHPGNFIGGGGLTFATQGVMTLNVSGNNMRDAHGSAITLFKAASGTSLSGTINGNTIGAAGVPNSGSATGNGIFLTSNGVGAVTLAITNNNIRNYSGNGGIFADNTTGTYSVNLTITGNTTAEPGPFAFTGLALTAGAPASTDDIDVCANITGNDFSQGDPNNSNDVILGVSTAASSMRLPGYAGTTLADVESFVLANNNVAGTAVVAFVDPPATAANFVGGAACSTP